MQLPDSFLHIGRMLSGSKSGYASRPGTRPIFNANICTEEGGKIWFGDLDLARESDRTAIQSLADHLGKQLFILTEHDARFENEAKPRLDRAVETFTPTP